MDPEFKYRAFISYSHSDERWAKWLHKALETYSVPKRLVGTETAYGPVPARLAPVFRDRDELATATNLGETLTRALEQSAFQIVICSPAAAKSRWVGEEIETLDDIAGLGQSEAALELCSGIAEARKQHFVVPGAGHYGIFSGRKYREQVVPRLHAFFRQHP
jgi:hypothetical protein